jgi:ribosomal RNA-processing protein 12
VQLFKANLAAARKGPTIGSTDNMAATFQDILIFLLKNLGPTESTSLFDLCLSPEVLSGKDNGVQKRGYKILTKLVVNGKVPIDAETILRKMDDLTEGLTPAAKKVNLNFSPLSTYLYYLFQDRFSLLAALIDILPPTSLHLVPSLLPEAVLGTKEPSEKARTAAFEVILALGRKMSSGGVVKKSMVDGMDEDTAEDGTLIKISYIALI